MLVEPSLKGLVQRQLARQSAPSRPSAEPGFTVKSTALAGLLFRAQVEGHSFISDHGIKSGGLDAGPAPMRYFLAGLMMCHQTWTLKSAALLDLQLDRLEGEMASYRDASEPDGSTRISYKVLIESTHSDGDVETVVDQATHRCGAFRLIQNVRPIDVTISHNGKMILERTYHGE